MNQEHTMSFVGGLIIVSLFIAALCIFVKWAGKKEGYEFHFGRVILMFFGSIVCGGPLALLAWYIWPLETWIEKLVPLLSFIAFVLGPLLPIRLLGWKLFLPKKRERKP